jgi:mycobactin peptide synthetase MbtF
MWLADTDVTARLLSADTPPQQLLAQAAARMVTRWRAHRGQDPVTPLLALETHGRADDVVDSAIDDVDTSDTVGLLTAIYPLRVPAHGAVPTVCGAGVDYGLLRYARADTAERLRAHAEPQILLNFLGHVHTALGGVLRPDRALLEAVSPLPEPNVAVRHELTILAAVLGEGDGAVLGTQWRTLPDILSGDDVQTLQAMWRDALLEVVR